MRHSRVSCSPIRSAALAIGIALASASTIGFKQQRETRTRARPGRRDLVHAAVRASHPRRARVQKRAMLKEIQMPPRLVLRVVDRASFAPASRTGEPAPAREIHVQIEPTILRVENSLRITVQGDERPKGQLEKIGVSHPATIIPIPTLRSPITPPKSKLPTPFSEEPKYARLLLTNWVREVTRKRMLTQEHRYLLVSHPRLSR